MAVAIRLRREGARNSPYYKIVVADQRKPRDGKFIEIIGTYDPKKKGDNFTLQLERADYWVGVGATAFANRRQHHHQSPKESHRLSGP